MITKTFEIRDQGTFIPMLAIKLQPTMKEDQYLFSRAGYGREASDQAQYILLCQISGGGGRCQSDFYEWGNGRTYRVAHRFIQENFDRLSSGEVIDVEFILGETQNPKESERHGPY